MKELENEIGDKSFDIAAYGEITYIKNLILLSFDNLDLVMCFRSDDIEVFYTVTFLYNSCSCNLK